MIPTISVGRSTMLPNIIPANPKPLYFSSVDIAPSTSDIKANIAPAHTIPGDAKLKPTILNTPNINETIFIQPLSFSTVAFSGVVGWGWYEVLIGAFSVKDMVDTDTAFSAGIGNAA
jgi:hypothetical protein